MRKKLLAMICMSLFLVAGFSAFAQITINETHVGEEVFIPQFPGISITGADVSSVSRYDHTIVVDVDGTSIEQDVYVHKASVSIKWSVSGGRESMYPFTAEVSALVKAVQYGWEGGTREVMVTEPRSFTTCFSGEVSTIGKTKLPPVELMCAQITSRNSMLFGFAFHFWPIGERPFAGTVYTEEDNGTWYTGRAAYETYVLPDDAFDKNPEQRKDALLLKYFEVFEKINDEEYQGAINKLEKDIRAKMDGSVDGNPKNDWVTDTDAQERLCTLIDAATGNLREIT